MFSRQTLAGSLSFLSIYFVKIQWVLPGIVCGIVALIVFTERRLEKLK